MKNFLVSFINFKDLWKIRTKNLNRRTGDENHYVLVCNFAFFEFYDFFINAWEFKVGRYIWVCNCQILGLSLLNWQLIKYIWAFESEDDLILDFEDWFLRDLREPLNSLYLFDSNSLFQETQIGMIAWTSDHDQLIGVSS